MKCSAAVMYLSTTLKHAAEKSLSIMKLTSADLAKDGSANSSANMFQATIGSMSAVSLVAQALAQLDNFSFKVEEVLSSTFFYFKLSVPKKPVPVSVPVPVTDLY